LDNKKNQGKACFDRAGGDPKKVETKEGAQLETNGGKSEEVKRNPTQDRWRCKTRQ